MPHCFRFLSLVTSVALIIGFAPVSTARGAELTVSGFTNGCFGAGCTPTADSGPQGADLGGIHFSNANFSATTVGGSLTTDLGLFSVSIPPIRTYSDTFNLLTTFTAPGTTPTSSTLSAIVSGNIFAGGDEGSGSVTFDFDNTPRLFLLNDGGGLFTLTVGDVTVPGNGEGSIVGTVNFVEAVSPNVPEPTTLALLASGVLGLAARTAFRRRLPQ